MYLLNLDAVPFVASRVGPSSSKRMVSLDLRYAMLVMVPLCFVPIMLLSSQSPRSDFALIIADLCAISMRPWIKPHPAVAVPRLLLFLPRCYKFK